MRRIGGDADIAFASVTDQAADALEEVRLMLPEIRRRHHCRVPTGCAKSALAVGDRVDVAVNLSKAALLPNNPIDIVS